MPVRDAIAAIETDGSGFTVHSVSQTLTNEDITNLINEGLDRTFITIGLTFIILLITFGAFVASIVPLVLAVTALVAAFGILGIFSQLVSPASPYATQLVVLIGLAVSVDYSLFMITRFRSERREGKPKLLAIETASSTAGRAVFFSGLAVMISIAGLFMIDVSIFRSMAIGTIGVIFVAIIGSLTFLPATLAILGDRINTGRVPFFGRDRDAANGLWARFVLAVMRRPWRYAILATAFMLILASPWIRLRIGLTDFTSFPDEIDGVQAVKLIDAKWPQGGIQNLQVAVTGYDRAETKAAVEAFKTSGPGGAGAERAGRGLPVHVTGPSRSCRSRSPGSRTIRPRRRRSARCARPRCPPRSDHCRASRPTSPATRRAPSTSPRSTSTRSRSCSRSSSACRSCCCSSSSIRW